MMSPRAILRRLTLIAFLALTPALRAAINPDWTTRIPPFKIADNLYYVGSRDLASYLITTPAGNILIDSNLPSSPPQIRHSVEQLGFRWSDTKILLIAHAHFDHAGGSAQILRETHAKYMVMDADVSPIETGGRTDFAANTDGILTYPPAHVDRILHDGDTVTLGNVTLTAHKTPGHTRGCTTWTFRTHMPGDPAGKLRNVVIVGGFTILTQYHLIDTPRLPASYPGMAADYAHTLVTLRSLPCDIFLGAHGLYFNMLAKLARYPQQGPAVFIDPEGYQQLIAQYQLAYDTELKKEQAAK